MSSDPKVKIEHLTRVSYTKWFDSFQDLCEWTEKVQRELKKRGFFSFEVTNNQINSSKGRYECTCSAIRVNKKTNEQNNEGLATLPE